MRNILTLLILLTSSLTESSELKTKNDVINFSKKIQATIGNGNIIQAVNFFRPHTPIPSSELDTLINQIKIQQSAINQRLGKTIGTELIGIEERGESAIQVTFLQKFEKNPMRWRLYFYKSKSRWLLTAYLTDDDLSRMFASE